VHHSGYIGEPSRTVSLEVLRVASLWLAIYFGVLVWSAINPHDYFTWFLEVAPALLGVLVLWATRRSFPLTTLAYSLVLFHCIVLMIGGHYTYAEVPLFNMLEDAFGWTRNHYDRLGHLTQGFVPAVLAREILLRRRVLAKRSWTGFLVLCICLALSASYELIEWAVAASTGTAAEAFLGTQGDPWDTQSDIALAGVGAILSLMLCRRVHDKQLRKFSSL
jgi:putative membrane protein